MLEDRRGDEAHLVQRVAVLALLVAQAVDEHHLEHQHEVGEELLVERLAGLGGRPVDQVEVGRQLRVDALAARRDVSGGVRVAASITLASCSRDRNGNTGPMTTFETMRLERDGDIATLTLTRPELLNRIDAAAHRELVAGFRELQAMSGLRAVLFEAEGRVFSAGGDFELMLQAHADLRVRTEMIQEALQVVQALLDISAPVVVALHGDAIGLGATVVLAADAVVTHATVRIADPHVAIGLVAGDGGCLVWPQAVGMMRAKRHLLTGDPVSGEEAHRIGLVSDLVEREEVPAAARALAERLAALPPLAVQGTKRALNEVLRHRFAEVMAISLANELTSLGSDDLREAIAAFKERRTPTFTGR